MDYEFFARWTREEIYFVTRQRENARFRVVKENPIPEKGKILRDSIIEYEGFYAKQDCPYQLRRIEVREETKGEVIVLLTNHLEFGSTTIARIYKDRWQIEVFFKTIKQKLRIKTFVGTTLNAVMTQIWTALIVILILKYMKYRSSFNWSLSNLVALLRINLFTYRDLWEWINKPYETLPIVPDIEKLTLKGF